VRHFTSPAFWDCLEKLPPDVQDLAEKNFSLLKSDPDHPSLHLKKVGNYYSVRVGIHYRALAVKVPEGLL
jgi:mRNA-degrading endonuclease RelE of RelBE toxin-antitoxin system